MKKWMAGVSALLFVLLFMGCAVKEKTPPETPNATFPAIMYEGKVYRTTGKQIPAEVDPSAVVGEIVSVIPLSQLPEGEGEANFGEIGDSYAVTADGLLVVMNEEWVLFEPVEGE